jgi:hypothetical protein
VWKAIYASYKLDYLESEFEKVTLRKRLWETLWELKTRTLNEEGSNIVVLQNEEMLVCLKSTNGHAMHNVLKCRQSLINGINSLTTPFTSNFILGICSSICSYIHSYGFKSSISWACCKFKPLVYFHSNFSK